MSPHDEPTNRIPPSLTVLVDAADAALHAWVRERVPAPVRRVALAEELSFWLDTAAQDMAYASGFAKAAPQSGQPVEAYLDRWVGLGSSGHVLVGPRYLGRNPDLPFVGVSAADRPLVSSDRDRLMAIAWEEFAAFAPGFVMATTADPIGAWPDTRPEMRQLVGLLGELRGREVPAELSTSPCADTSRYERYRRIYDIDVGRDSARPRQARCEERDELQEYADRGTLFDVWVVGEWAGVLAGRPDARRGVRGATVAELVLDHPYRGRGYGRHLSTLLARALPMPDEQCLMGTVHADNLPAYRAALSAGRIDVGGEVVIPL